MNHTQSKTIVFIHGLFMNPRSWEAWIHFFEQLGYTCHAPAYAYHDGEPRDLRQHINPKLGELTFGQVIADLSGFIDTLPEQPILIGHSMGGLAVQKLIALNKGVAGICIDPAPPKGVVSFAWSFIKSNLPIINPLKGNSAVLPSVEWFHYAFCNTMSLAQAEVEYKRFVVPESRNIPRSSSKDDGYIDLSQPHAPLLIIAGEKDHIIPASLNRKNYEAYTDKNSRTDFKMFAGRSHYICAQDNWQEVARFVNDWILSLKQ